MNEFIEARGFVKLKIKYKDRVEFLEFKNKVLNSGKEYMASCLLESTEKPYIANIIFGDGGAEGEIKPSQEGLIGVTRIKKQVVSQINPENPTQVIFTVIIAENEGNGIKINEMGLELSNGKLYSLVTFNDLDKTDDMELEWSWHAYFI